MPLLIFCINFGFFGSIHISIMRIRCEWIIFGKYDILTTILWVLRFWGPQFATGIHLMKQFAHNWYLPCCQGTEACYHVSVIQNDIYTLVPGVNNSVENRSCPESTHCCSQYVIPLSWCQSVFDGWVVAEWLGHWLQQWAATGVSKILGSPVRHWHPPHEAILSYLVFTLLPMHGGIVSLSCKINQYYDNVEASFGLIQSKTMLGWN